MAENLQIDNFFAAQFFNFCSEGICFVRRIFRPQGRLKFRIGTVFVDIYRFRRRRMFDVGAASVETFVERRLADVVNVRRRRRRRRGGFERLFARPRRQTRRFVVEHFVVGVVDVRSGLRRLPVDVNVARFLRRGVPLLRHLDGVDNVDVFFALKGVQFVLPVGLGVGLGQVEPSPVFVEDQDDSGHDGQDGNQDREGNDEANAIVVVVLSLVNFHDGAIWQDVAGFTRIAG
jgi:hypothetical protein